MANSRVIVLSGASRGLGRAMVEEFVRRGHRVAACARSERGIGELRERFPGPHRFETVDVSLENQVGAWAQRALEEFGAPDLLLNNAAIINRNARLWDVPPEEFSRVVDANVKGSYHLIRHFVPAMIERGSGVIVNFSSGWGRHTSPEVAPYCATKWAIEGLTRALAQELPAGLATVSLHPGVIHTDMLASCFGAAAACHESPETWAQRAVPYLLDLGPKDNGQPLRAP